MLEPLGQEERYVEKCRPENQTSEIAPDPKNNHGFERNDLVWPPRRQCPSQCAERRLDLLRTTADMALEAPDVTRVLPSALFEPTPAVRTAPTGSATPALLHRASVAFCPLNVLRFRQLQPLRLSKQMSRPTRAVNAPRAPEAVRSSSHTTRLPSAESAIGPLCSRASTAGSSTRRWGSTPLPRIRRATRTARG